nr:MFS transporter [Rhodoblastus acidophilus]
MAVGLLGILIAAMTAGFSNRVAALALADVRGALGFGVDEFSWLGTVYSAGELVAMPFATWCAITFSLRRFHMAMLAAMMGIAAVLPFCHSLVLLLALRALQGVCGGALMPVLMMSALRFLPPPIRLHGLAFYAMTATFAPNVALEIAALSLDRLDDWRWVYWQVVPLGLIAMALVYWGAPKLPMALGRLREANWLGAALGAPGLALLVVVMDQGLRLDWLNSSLIRAALLMGSVLTALFVVSEWRHPAPFMRLQLLARKNLGLGFTIFVCLLVTLATGVALPATALQHGHNFRMPEVAWLGSLVGAPQLVLGSAVALLLYQPWVDARYLFCLGLLCIAGACSLAAGVTSEWMAGEFFWVQALHMVGQPMAIVSLLFLATSVVAPPEGAFVSGIVNTLRALGTTFGAMLIGEIMKLRGDFHAEILLGAATRTAPTPGLAGLVAEQAAVLATADIYRIFAFVALALIPLVLCLQKIPAPKIAPPPKATPPQTASAT